ncbi:hypothetical protein LTR17_008212 [Elasticomyces elasticus]|nr:hypothetical protein LTR17_008212 [Elasticomyces elasticus]
MSNPSQRSYNLPPPRYNILDQRLCVLCSRTLPMNAEETDQRLCRVHQGTKNNIYSPSDNAGQPPHSTRRTARPFTPEPTPAPVPGLWDDESWFEPLEAPSRSPGGSDGRRGFVMEEELDVLRQSLDRLTAHFRALQIVVERARESLERISK